MNILGPFTQFELLRQRPGGVDPRSEGTDCQLGCACIFCRLCGVLLCFDVVQPAVAGPEAHGWQSLFLFIVVRNGPISRASYRGYFRISMLCRVDSILLLPPPTILPPSTKTSPISLHHLEDCLEWLIGKVSCWYGLLTRELHGCVIDLSICRPRWKCMIRLNASKSRTKM